MTRKQWSEETSGGVRILRPSDAPDGLLVAFSGAGVAPAGEISQTAFLARRFASVLGLDGTPIVRATQVHGDRSVTIREAPAENEVLDAGQCDVLATDLAGVGLVVQTADCVPIVLAGERAIGVVHAGWRGSAKNAVGTSVAALVALGERSDRLRAWLGPSIGACCYEVGGEVAAQFAGQFVRARCGAGYFLDLRAANAAQLEAAGLPAESISAHPACTKCGGKRWASYRRDGAKSGRMIALIARFAGAGFGIRDAERDT